MNLYASLRKGLGVTQAGMARLCQLSRHHWGDVESGVTLPGPQAVRRIEALTGLAGLPSSVDSLTADEIRRLAGPRCYSICKPRLEGWRRFGPGRSGLRVPYQAWMERMLPADSALECRGWVQFALRGARPQISNPHSLGFRAWPIVDAEGQLLGERKLAGLRGCLEGLQYVVWPQVLLRPQLLTFRVDGLAFLRRGRHVAWSIVEFDGHGHRPEQDRYRAGQLQLPEIRVGWREVGQTVDLFQARALCLLGCSQRA